MPTNSPFVVGTKVALISSYYGNRTISPRIVKKVHANGHFFLDDKPGARMWTPNKTGDMDGNWFAHPAGRDTPFERHHAALWTAAHDAELATQRDKRRRSARIEAVKTAVGQFNPAGAHLDPVLDTIEDALLKAGLLVRPADPTTQIQE
jgi:hypothetical protein